MTVDAPVTKIMTTPVHAIGVDRLLSEARRLMTRERIHHVAVVDDRKIVGLISAGDILRLGYGDAPENPPLSGIMDHRHPLRDVMQKDLVTIGRDQTIRKAAELLSTGSYHALPVVDAEGELVGMVTSTDLARFVAAQS